MNADDMEQWRLDINHGADLADENTDGIWLQVLALEEFVAARWPRRLLVRWRLARDLRRSVAHIDGDTWAERRVNTISSGWLERREWRA